MEASSSDGNEKCKNGSKSIRTINSSSGLVENSSKKKIKISSWGSSQTVQKPILLVFLMCLIVAVLQIPSVLYYTEPPSVEVSLLDSVDLESCSVKSLDLFQSFSTKPLIEICNERLLCNCSGQVPIEQLYFLQFMDGLSSVTRNARCSMGMLPLLCDIITLQDVGNTSPSATTGCIDVRDNKCTSEWRIIEAFLNTSLLDCASFNDSKVTSFSRAPLLDCPGDFGVFCGSLCQPVCAEISLFSDEATTTYKILSIICYCICIIGGVINLTACYFHRNKMFHFPLIYVVYNTVVFQIVSLFLLLPYIIGSDYLLCSHPNLIVTYSKPTVFCKLQGMVVHCGAFIVIGFLMFHLTHLLHNLMKPFRAQILMKSVRFTRVAHITEVAVVLICGGLPSIVLFSLSSYGYSGFPPMCYSKNPAVLFYTVILPISIGSTIILCLLLTSIWILLLNMNFQSPREKCDRTRKRVPIKDIIKYSTPEVKLIILFSYYSVTVILLLIRLVVNLRSINTAVHNVTNLTLCSAGGDKMECDKYKQQLHKNMTPSVIFDLISIMFIALINFINLLYVLQYQDYNKFKETLKHTIYKSSTAN